MTPLAPADLVERVARLRDEFDSAFTEPVRPPAEPTEDILAVRVDGQPYALRLTELAGLHANRPITPCAGVHPAFLGFACLRGMLVAVYDLGRVLGGGPASRPRWMVSVRDGPEVAFAFDELERQVRVPRSSLTGATAEPAEPLLANVRIGATVRPAVSTSAALRRLFMAVEAARGQGERP